MNFNNEKKIVNPSPIRLKWINFSKRIKPWNTSFFSRTNYSLPSDKNLYDRIRKNLTFYEANYIIISIFLIIIGL